MDPVAGPTIRNEAVGAGLPEFSEVARLLSLMAQQLAKVAVTRSDGAKVTLDWVPRVSVSIQSFFNSPHLRQLPRRRQMDLHL